MSLKLQPKRRAAEISITIGFFHNCHLIRQIEQKYKFATNLETLPGIEPR